MLLRMRCPDCSARYGIDLSGAGEPFSFEGMRSLLPAVKRGMSTASSFFSSALRDRRCGLCGSPVTVRIAGRHTPTAPSAAPLHLIPERSLLVINCSRCGQATSDIVMGLLVDPGARAFFLDRPRIFLEPDTLSVYGGQDAIRVRLVDLATGERLTIMVHPGTAEIMATLFE